MTGPLSEKQAAFLRAEDARINVLTGSVRSGKTYASLLKWALFVQGSEADSEFIMCGKTMITLERNCLTLLARLTGRFTYSLSKKEGWLYGRRVWLEGANDEQAESKIRGLTLWGAYVDELTLVPEGFYRMLLSRLSAPGARLYATTNPDAPGHWAKEAVIDAAGPDVAVWTFLLRDNVFLDPEYVEAIERQYTGIWRERYILGRWTRAEGVIYPLFADEPARFLVDGADEPVALATIGVDFGGNKSASAFVAVGFTRGFGRAIVLDEMRRPAAAENPETLAEAFVAFAKGVLMRYPMCPAAYCDSAEQVLMRGLAVALARAGVPLKVKNARKGPVNGRIRLVNGLLASGRLTIARGCGQLIRALTDAVWDDKRPDDARLDDGTTDIDTLDAFEYAMEPCAQGLLGAGLCR